MLRAVLPFRGWRRTAYAVTAGALLCAPGAALAQSPGGVEAGEPAPPTGGASVPRLTTLRCRARCVGASGAQPGATLDLRGARIARVESVVFLGDASDADDVTVAARKVTSKRVIVQVPRFAHTGPVAVVDGDGVESAPTRAPLTVSAVPPSPGVSVEVQSPKVFFDATRRARVSYAVSGDAPVDVDIALVQTVGGAEVARWTASQVAPGTPQTATWNGMIDGAVAPAGRYEFRVTVHGQAASAQAAPPQDDAFDFLDHRFPIAGAHTFGTGVAAFGGARHHQGEDVFAACGTPMVAARGGKVKFKQYHARAGNYLVIDGEKTDVDYAYMHLRDPALVSTGDRVRTGQLIGYVGDTGDAQGCHLHFELWSGPGWYDGGKPFDPLPLLKAWDAAS
jgi:murein DD-endopeptidase MepM/ murein hydrolase activator NlpD